MVLSERERILAIVTGAVVGIIVLYGFVGRLIVRPLQRVENQKQQLDTELKEAHNLFKRREQLEKQWSVMLSDGLGDEAEAESSIARALDGWSQDAGLTLTSVQPQRVAGEKGVREITFVVAGKGSLGAVASFLYQVETAEMPIKVKNMQLGSSSEYGDSMSLQLTLSTLYLGTAQKSSETQSKPKQQEANDEEQLM
jgi:Tfp pilus assembly protein PilO